MVDKKIKDIECKNEDLLDENGEVQNNFNDSSEDSNTENDENIKYMQDLESRLKVQNEQFLRLAAEYENYRKRSDKDKVLIYKDAKADAVFEMLPIADCIEKAIESSKGADEEYQKGLKMLNEQFIFSLKKLGIESFGQVGEQFDPQIHNAISHIDDTDFEENVISQVFQKGYRLGDKIVRHAMVSVAN